MNKDRKKPQNKDQNLRCFVVRMKTRFEHIQEYNFVKYWKENYRVELNMERLKEKEENAKLIMRSPIVQNLTS